MTIGQVAFILVLPAVAGLTIWYYPHCARPPLAYASVAKLGFLVCLSSTGFIVAGCVILWVDLFANVLGRGTGQVLTALMILGWVPLATALLRPHWFRVLGPADATARPRFLLTWFRREWGRLDGDGQRVGFAEMLQRQLESIRQPSNAAYVDAWIQALQAFVHGTDLGKASGDRERIKLEAALDAVVPLDPIARWI